MIVGIIAIILGVLIILFSKSLTKIFFIHGPLGTGQTKIQGKKKIGNNLQIRAPPTVNNYYGKKPLGNYLIKLLGFVGIILGLAESFGFI